MALNLIHKTDMRRLMLMLFMAAVAITGNAATNINDDEPYKEEIRIVTRGHIKKDRDLFPDAQATMYYAQKLIEIQMFELGETQIYVVDSFGRVVFEELVDGNNNIATFEAPEKPGSYTLVIWSSNYYGEGTFCIRR